MFFNRLLATLMILPAAVTFSHAATSSVSGNERVARRLLRTTVPFVENRGAEPFPVRFTARTFGGSVFVTEAGEVVYKLSTAHASGRGAWALRESFPGPQPVPPRGNVRSKILVSRFIGPDSSRWERGGHPWERVDIGEAYPGIHVELRATGGSVEKLFRIAAGADPGAIHVAVAGADALGVDEQQRLVLHTRLGKILFTAPEAFQVIDGQRRAVPVAYRVEDHRYGFAVGEYDHDHELVIDPVLASTLVGGEDPTVTGNYDDDIVYAVVPYAGYVYIAGVTQAPNFPVKMGYDETYNGGLGDAFVTKMTDDLSTIVASTYIGTDSRDNVRAMAVSDDGRLYIAGAAGFGFPNTPGAYNWRAPDTGYGCYVAILSDDLATLVASAIVSPTENLLSMEPGNGGVYFGGTTKSPDMPITPDAWDPTCGTDGNCNPDGFGIRHFFGFAGEINADLTAIEHMTYLDGGSREGGKAVNDIAVGRDGTVYIADGSDSAVTGKLRRFDGGLSTLLGHVSMSSSSRTYFKGVAVADDHVVAIGQTYDEDFLPRNGTEYDTGCGTDGHCDPEGPFDVPQPDGFAALFSLDLQVTQAVTFLGGSDDEAARHVALGSDGSVFVVGETISTDFPTTGDGTDATCGTDGLCNPTAEGTILPEPVADAFLARFSADLTQLSYATYLGGSDEEEGNAVAIDGRRAVWVGGKTASTDFPTTAGAYDSSYNGGTSDAYVTSFDTGGVLEAAGRIPGAWNVLGDPLLLSRSGSDIVLNWSSICGGGSDYAVYEGVLGDPASLSPRQCSTGGATTATLTPGTGQQFYLIVAQTADSEGSYGRDSRGVERSPSVTACQPQAIGACP